MIVAGKWGYFDALLVVEKMRSGGLIHSLPSLTDVNKAIARGTGRSSSLMSKSRSPGRGRKGCKQGQARHKNRTAYQ